MSLKSIVHALGGELYDRGFRANIPAPGHSAADRSVSLLLRDGRIVVHTFGDGDWRAVLDDLRARGLIDANNAPTSIAGSRRRLGEAAGSGSDRQRLEVARRLWDGGRAIAGTLSERHCRLRSIKRPLPGPDVARHNSETPVSAYGDHARRRPALLVALTDADGVFTAVEITYLAGNGRRTLDLRLPRKTVGPVPPGSAVRLDPAAPEMLVAEGVYAPLSTTPAKLRAADLSAGPSSRAGEHTPDTLYQGPSRDPDQWSSSTREDPPPRRLAYSGGDARISDARAKKRSPRGLAISRGNT